MINFQREGITAVVLDMDGVLWRESEPIGNLPAIFSKLDKENVKVVLATNNAMKSVSQFVNKINNFGVNIEDWQVATSAQAVSFYLKQKYPLRTRVYVVGMDSLKSEVGDAGYTLCDSNVAAVVVGVDRDITYDKIKIANRLIREGAEFIGTNPDKTYPTPEGLAPGAGSIIAAVAAAAERDPVFVGKPGKILMDLSISKFNGIQKYQILMVGDRLETDIAAGQACGCRTALVLSGVTTSEMAEKWLPEPDFIFKDLSDLVGV